MLGVDIEGLAQKITEPFVAEMKSMNSVLDQIVTLLTEVRDELKRQGSAE